MGAEVIKIETAEGETMRTRPPVRNSCSTAFGQLNVGKKSLVLDLKSPEAVEVVRRLVAGADILVENFRPGVMRRLKLDYGSLRELNPKLIYCSISGYGQTGPSAELPAYAPVIHAASGYEMAHLAYQPGRSRPDYCGIYHADVLTGVYAFGAISAALYQRTAAQQGQHIDVSMLESMLSLTLNELQWSQFEVKPTPAADVRSDRNVGRICDGRDRQRENLPEPDEGDRSSRVDRPIRALRNIPTAAKTGRSLMDGVEAWSRTLTTEKCLAALNGDGVPVSAYRTVAEALARSANRPSRRAGRSRGRRRHIQGAEPAVPHVRRHSLGGKAHVDAGRAHASRCSRRPAFRRMKSRPSRASRWWRSAR